MSLQVRPSPQCAVSTTKPPRSGPTAASASWRLRNPRGAGRGTLFPANATKQGSGSSALLSAETRWVASAIAPVGAAPSPAARDWRTGADSPPSLSSRFRTPAIPSGPTHATGGVSGEGRSAVGVGKVGGSRLASVWISGTACPLLTPDLRLAGGGPMLLIRRTGRRPAFPRLGEPACAVPTHQRPERSAQTAGRAGQSRLAS